MFYFTTYIFYPNGTEWESTYTSPTIAENVLQDKICENHSIRGYVYDHESARRIMTYGMALEK